ncbi:TolC family protein [Pedobacter insulae]|uniref:Outer membrane protein TolC n=1 Tax=Pedobacter insulae TaxID=414048 RepID=A0A1I2XJ02_9SPHI|nr:TolC family protein [Pedobacter insulae]SFH13440.1 Outer membrane protein TolC [Pedobacter insulae]
MQHTFKLVFATLLLPTLLQAQSIKEISLSEAVELGIANSKNLKLAQSKIDEVIAKLNIVNDNALPSASASFLYNHAEIPTRTLGIGGGGPIHLPTRADAFVGTASIQELIYGGNKLKYARESTKLLADIVRLDLERNKEEVRYAVINTYFALYKLRQSKKIVNQNLGSIASQLKQAQKFFAQGVVTKNDVLRFQLQQANISLTNLEIENNLKIVNYNLAILLGLAEDTEIIVEENDLGVGKIENFGSYLNAALTSRQELQQLELQNKVADYNIKTIKADKLPTVGLGANLYYINPSGSFIPPTNQFVVPVTFGATVSWNVANLWKNKHRVAEAAIQQRELEIQKTILSDQLKTEVNKNYQTYLLSVQKIDVLQTSIVQATENDHLLDSKYRNNIASVTDRIDAETLLYQAKINLEIAKAEAGLAYYTLLKSTGKISK